MSPQKAIHRLFEYLEYKGIPHTRFEKEIGLSNGYLKSMLRREGGLGEEIVLNVIENCLDLNIGWLMTGNGQMLINSEKYATNDIELSTVNEPIIRYGKSVQDRLIPFYNLHATAGLLDLFDQEQVTQPDDYILIPDIGKCDGSMTVVNDSMEDLISPGDILAFKIIHDVPADLQGGQIYIVLYEIADELQLVVKYIKKSSKGDEYIILESHNKHYDSKEIHLSKVKQVALVKAWIKRKITVK